MPSPIPVPPVTLGPAQYLKLAALACDAFAAYVLRKDVKTVASDVFQAVEILGLKAVLPVSSESEFQDIAKFLISN